MSAERDLLFGVMAVQLGLVSAKEVMGAAGAWASDRSRGLASRLAAVVPEDKRAMIQALVDEAIRVHGGDAKQTLQSLGGARAVEDSFAGSVVLGPDGQPEPVPLPEPDAAGADGLLVTDEHAGRYGFRGPDGRPVQGRSAAELGRGGIGRVLLAFDEHLGREVAVKELLPGRSGEPATGSSARRTSIAVARFLREARVTGQLEHPNVVPVYELGQRSDGSLYYTMKVVRGRTLAAAMGQHKRLADRLGLLPHFVDLCQAVGYAHSRGVVHRDVKPDNVMLGEFGETVVLDWGLAKVHGSDDLHGATLQRGVRQFKDSEAGQTVAGSAVGTPAYMSPEQAEGLVEAVDERSDVWSLGAVLYEILTGHPPFEGHTAYEVIGKVIREPVRPVAQLAPDAPAELASICEKALQRDPARRYQAARELAHDVTAFLTGGRVEAYEYRLGELLGRFAARHKGPLAVGLVALALLIGLGVVSYRQVVEARERAVARLAEATREGAESAMLRGDVLEARAKVRQTLEVADSVGARALWRKLSTDARVWRLDLGAPVVAADFSPDGSRLAVSAGPGIRLIDARTRAIRAVLRGHDQTVNSVAFDPAGNRIASVGQDRRVRLWTRSAVGAWSGRVLGEHAKVAYEVAFSPSGDRLASVSMDGAVKLWRLEPDGPDPGRLEADWQAHPDGSLGLAFSPSGRNLATCGADAKIRLWDLSSLPAAGAGPPEPVRTFSGHTGWVWGLDFSPDGRLLASGGTDTAVLLWDVASGERVQRFEGHTAAVWDVRFAPGGRTLASVGHGRHVRFWDLDTRLQLPGYDGFADRVYALAYDPSGRTLAVGGQDQTLLLLRPDRLRAGPSSAGHEGWALSVDFDPSGELVVSGGQDGTVRIRRVADGVLVRTLEHPEPVYHVAVRPGGGLVAVHAGDVIHLWDLASGVRRRVIGGNAAIAGDFVFSPDGARLAIGGQDGQVRLFEVDTGQQVGRLEGSGLVSYAVYSPDGRRLAAGAPDGSVRLFDAANGRRIGQLAGHELPIYRLAFGPRGERLLTASYDGSVRLWDLASGAGRVVFASDDASVPVYGATFLKDGRLALARPSGLVAVFDPDTEQPRFFRAHLGVAFAAQPGPAGRLLATAGQYGEIRLWELASGRPLWRCPAVLSAPAGLIDHRGFAPIGPTDPPAAAGPMLEAVKQRAKRAVQPPGGGPICLLTWESGIELWAADRAEPLAVAETQAGEDVRWLGDGCAVLTAAGQVVRMDRSGALTELVGAGAVALGGRGPELLVATENRILAFAPNGTGRELGEVDPNPSALTRLQDELLVGYRDGTVERLGDARAPVRLEQAAAAPVTALLPGPSGTLACGFGDGQVGLWLLSDGSRLEHARLHGPVIHLALADRVLVAASELGARVQWDLSSLDTDRCALLRQVWAQVPVGWSTGRARIEPPPPGHPCAAARAAKQGTQGGQGGESP